MLFSKIDTSIIKPNEAVIAETTNNTYVTLAHFRGGVQIVFESYLVGECVAYAVSHGLLISTDRRLGSSAHYGRYAGLVYQSGTHSVLGLTSIRSIVPSKEKGNTTVTVTVADGGTCVLEFNDLERFVRNLYISDKTGKFTCRCHKHEIAYA